MFATVVTDKLASTLLDNYTFTHKVRCQQLFVSVYFFMNLRDTETFAALAR